jgi:urease accessory protein
MLVLRDIVTDASPEQAADCLTLGFERRRLSRQRAELDSGEEVALILPRGASLLDGSVLRGDDGRLVRVRAAAEGVSRATSADVLLLTRAAYHLGNRHIAVEVHPGRLSYLHDHVLDDLVRGLGLEVTFAEAPFEPEQGAYAESAGHAHHH